MWPAMIIKINSVANHSAGMLRGFKSLTMHILLPQRSNGTLHDPVFLRAIGRGELLLQSIASDQGGAALACKDQSIVRLK